MAGKHQWLRVASIVMEIFHLRYFVEVAENLSFSRAARGLHMATSPLSQRIRDLERELGMTLFERDSHNVELTEAGRHLLPAAKDVVHRFDDIPWRMRQAVGSSTPTVFIGVAPGLHSRVRDRLIHLEHRCAQDFRIKRWPANTDELVRSVSRGELAMALVHLPVHASSLGVVEVTSEPLGAVLPRAEFGDHTSVRLDELTDHSYVVPAPATAPTYFEQLEKRLDNAGIKKQNTPQHRGLFRRQRVGGKRIGIRHFHARPKERNAQVPHGRTGRPSVRGLLPRTRHRADLAARPGRGGP